ncbi:MAG: type IV pilus assembly protein PilM [Actinomycetota bacterium]|nr:type IV pilus assembly protein PilM [Actinomycetota bacterium]
MPRVRIGLDIGATAVRAAELSVRGYPPTLVRAAQVPLPPGAVSGGEVQDRDAVVAALQDLWRSGKFRSKEVVLGVANQRVVVREVAVPWLEPKELRQSLPFQVQEYVPIPLEEAVLDFHVLEEFEQDARRMVRVLLVAAQKTMINQLVGAVEASKLRPVGLDLVPFAIVRSVGSSDGALDGEDEAIVDIGSDVTSICVHSWGVPRFVRILQSGGREVTEAISRALDVPTEEAERLKRGLDGQDPEKAAHAERVASDRAALFAQDVRSSLDFYLTQTNARLSRVLISGGGSKLDALHPVLEEELPADVVQGRPFHRVRPDLNLPEEVMAEAEPLLAVAVGLALPGGRG